MSSDFKELTEGVASFCEQIRPFILERLCKYWPCYQWELTYEAMGWDFHFIAKATVELNGKSYTYKWLDASHDLYRPKGSVDRKKMIDEIAVFLGTSIHHHFYRDLAPKADDYCFSVRTAKMVSSLEDIF